MTKEIPLNQNQVAILDDEDYEKIKKWNLHAYKNKSGVWYIRRTLNSKQIPLARILLSATKGVFADHINGDGLDNRRCNLRLTTASQNGINRRKVNGSSQYKGVSWNKPLNKWIVHIKKDGKILHLGCFLSEGEAAKTYNKKAIELFGEYARLNEIKD